MSDEYLEKARAVLEPFEHWMVQQRCGAIQSAVARALREAVEKAHALGPETVRYVEPVGLRARAERAEAERDEALERASHWSSKIGDEVRAQKQLLVEKERAEARVRELEAELQLAIAPVEANREGVLRRERDAALERAEKAEAERDQANFVLRYGTPFDPTGAKTGTEIQSLRAENKRLSLEVTALRRKLSPDVLVDDSLDELLAENARLAARVRELEAERNEALREAQRSHGREDIIAAERDAALAEKARWVRVADDLEVQEKLKAENARLAARVRELEAENERLRAAHPSRIDDARRLQAERDAALERAEKAEADNRRIAAKLSDSQRDAAQFRKSEQAQLAENARLAARVAELEADPRFKLPAFEVAQMKYASSNFLRLKGERDALQRQLREAREEIGRADQWGGRQRVRWEACEAQLREAEQMCDEALAAASNSAREVIELNMRIQNERGLRDEAEREVSALKVQLDRISGILMDAGDVPVDWDDLAAGVAKVAGQRDLARSDSKLDKQYIEHLRARLSAALAFAKEVHDRCSLNYWARKAAALLEEKPDA